MDERKIYVTQPSLPPLKEFLPYLERIWNSHTLTNNGPYHQELEQALCDYLGVEYISLFTNGTIALISALQALEIQGEVITTPYSFVATTHALLWNGITPVFSDIDPLTLNLDPRCIEEKITEKTTAIMPVHCYGRPCDVESIQKIADKHGLKVIYDAAHAFGVRCHHGQSVLQYGTLSVLSFHATKVFNTFEGGAIVSPDMGMKQRIDKLKNFGFTDEINVIVTGINGKMSEFNAALGLLQLKHMPHYLLMRKKIVNRYVEALKSIEGIQMMAYEDAHSNDAYFPILVTKKARITRDVLYEALKQRGVYTRRYFYPLISTFPMYQRLPTASEKVLPVATRIANEVLCLPIYPDLAGDDQIKIIDCILDVMMHQDVVS